MKNCNCGTALRPGTRPRGLGYLTLGVRRLMLAGVLAGTILGAGLPLAADTPEFNRELEVSTPRMHGDDVVLVQKRLLALGYRELGEADGWWGPKSLAALNRFRYRNGLEESPVLDEATWNVLWQDELRRGEKPAGDLPSILGRGHQLFGGWSKSAGWVTGENLFDWLDAAPFQTLRRFRQTRLLDRLECGFSQTPADLPYWSSPGLYARDDAKNGSLDLADWLLSGSHEPWPRTGVQYREAAQVPRAMAALTAWIKDQGIETAVEELEIMELDCDGDGKADWVLEASSQLPGIDEFQVPPGAWRVALVVLGGKTGPGAVQTVYALSLPEGSEFYTDTLERIADFIDANGDGRYEVLVDYRYYEGGGSTLLEWQGEGYVPVLWVGAGA